MGLEHVTDEQRARIAQRLSRASVNREDTGQLLPMMAAALEVGDTQLDRGARLEKVVEALASERVIVPISVETDPRQTGVHPGGEHREDFVRATTPVGEALVVYSSAQQLWADRPGARPMPLAFRKVALTALVETAGRVLLDPAGVCLVVPRAATAACAQGDTWLPAWRDRELVEALREHVDLSGVSIGVRMGEYGSLQVLVGIDEASAPSRDDLSALIARCSRLPRLLASSDRVEFVPVKRAVSDDTGR